MAEKHDNIFGLSGFGLEGFAHNPLRKLRHLTGPCYNTAMREIEKAIQFLVSPRKILLAVLRLPMAALPMHST
jgi:hypothetical protein